MKFFAVAVTLILLTTALPLFMEGSDAGILQDHIEWTVPLRHRINVRVSLDVAETNVPVSLWVDFTESVPEVVFNRDSIRVIEYNPVTGKPVEFSPREDGLMKYFIPSRFDEDYEGKALPDSGRGHLNWIVPGEGHTHFSIYFDSIGKDVPEMAAYPVGDGDDLRIRHGPISGGAWSIPIMADWDGDGDDDLILGTYINIEFYENTGSSLVHRGQLQDTYGRNLNYNFAPVITNRQGELCTPTVGDWDGDGDLDIIVGTMRAQLYYFERVGDYLEPKGYLKYANGEEIVLKGPYNYIRPYMCDWDDDGTTELLVASHGRLYIFDRDENGIFGPGAVPDSDGALIPGGPFCAGDIDADGDLDLIMGEYHGKLTIYENTGSAGVPRLEKREVVTINGVAFEDEMDSAPFVYDWDGDGMPDILVGNLLFGTIHTVFQTEHGWSYGGEIYGENTLLASYQGRPTLYDWDRDRDMDIFTGNEFGYVYYHENVGHRHNSIFADYTIVEDTEGRKVQVYGGTDPYLREQSGYSRAVVSDWNADGFPDMLVASDMGTISYWQNTGEGGWPFEAFGEMKDVDGNTIKTHHRASPAVYDWDGDGLSDLLLGGCDAYLPDSDVDGNGSTVRFYRNLGMQDGQPVLDSGLNLYVTDGGAGGVRNDEVFERRPSPAILDWDGDGDDDLISAKQLFLTVGREANGLPILDGPYDYLDHNLSEYFTGMWPIDISTGDINGDGDEDLFIASELGFISVLEQSYIHCYIAGNLPEATIITTEHGEPEGSIPQYTHQTILISPYQHHSVDAHRWGIMTLGLYSTEGEYAGLTLKVNGVARTDELKTSLTGAYMHLDTASLKAGPLAIEVSWSSTTSGAIDMSKTYTLTVHRQAKYSGHSVMSDGNIYTAEFDEEIVVDLGSSGNFSGLGICLRPHYRVSADVYIMSEGKEVLIASFDDAIHHYVEYFFVEYPDADSVIIRIRDAKEWTWQNPEVETSDMSASGAVAELIVFGTGYSTDPEAGEVTGDDYGIFLVLAVMLSLVWNKKRFLI